MKRKNNRNTWQRPNLPLPPLSMQTVRIKFSDSAAETVAIAGSFNDWRPGATPMVSLGAGRWVKELTLPPGSYEYCLIIDGTKWLPDPHALELIPNPFSGRNSLLTVPERPGRSCPPRRSSK